MTTNSRRNRPARILLAEDNRITASLIKIALQRTGVSHDLEMVHDGDAAIAALEHPDAVADLLLLDLHMPGRSGLDVLQHVKRQERLRKIPVVMLSSSQRPDDVSRAYDLHANAYVLKHPDFSDLCRSMDGVVQFWLRTAMIPFL